MDGVDGRGPRAAPPELQQPGKGPVRAEGSPLMNDEILPGSPGVPGLLISDRGDPEQRRRDRRRAEVHAEWRSAAWLAEIEESRAVPERLAELEAWGRRAELEMLRAPPDRPKPVRFGKTLSPAALAHEAALEREFMARNRAAAKAACLDCRQYTDGDCGRH